MKNKKSKVVFITEAIRRDTHAPLRYFDKFEVVHLYLKAPYGDMTKEDLKGARKVEINEMLEAIIDEKPDLIQGTEPFGSRLAYRLSVISYRASRHLKAKLVVPVLENRPIKERFNLWQRFALRLFCPFYFRQAAAVVALNKGAIKNVCSYFKKAKIVRDIIWGVWGVDLNLFKPVSKKRRGLIVYVGRLVEEKGLQYLLKAFKRAAEKIPFLHLNLIGQGPIEGELREYVKTNGLDKKVSFVGVIKNTQVPKYLSQAELAVYPSITSQRWEEQVGTVNFQALACGTPVLTTKSGAIPEYIKEGEGAMLVEQRNSQALAAAVERFFKNVNLKKRLTQKATSSAKKYDIKNEIGRAQTLFLKILNEKNFN